MAPTMHWDGEKMSVTTQDDSVLGTAGHRRPRRCTWRVSGPGFRVCEIYDLRSRAKISLTGGDRTRWLNGMVTNKLSAISERGTGYTLFCSKSSMSINRRDLYTYNRGESLLVDTDQSQVEESLPRLRQVHHHGRRRVTISRTSSAVRNRRTEVRRKGVEVPDLKRFNLSRRRGGTSA